MPYTQDVENCFAEKIGDRGLSRDLFDELLKKSSAGLEHIRQAKSDGSLPLLSLPERQDDLAELLPVAKRFRDSMDDVIVLGIGGSSLGGRSLYALADAGWGPERGGPKIHFMDNVDPTSFEALFARLDWKKTGLILISKSGGTAETLTQSFICLRNMADAGGEIENQAVAITENTDNPLRRLANVHKIPALEHDPKVGGRYSALSVVGMLPAAIAGLDVNAVRAGAGDALRMSLEVSGPGESPAAIGAAVAAGLAQESGVGTSVLMPYLDRFADFALWYAQLWAESLGKSGHGTTPVRAIGTVDQHSQMQLYLDGPKDKMFSFIFGPSAGTGAPVELAGFDPAGIEYLSGRTMGDLLDACQRATAETLFTQGHPVRIFKLDAVDERAMGALMMHYMLETIVTAHLWGVDPFDQPAVEDGKILARKYMTAMGTAVS